MTDRDDIESGNVWPDDDYVDQLERENGELINRVRDLELQLAHAEEILTRNDAFRTEVMAALDDVTDRLTRERYGPPPARYSAHPSRLRGDDDAA